MKIPNDFVVRSTLQCVSWGAAFALGALSCQGTEQRAQQANAKANESIVVSKSNRVKTNLRAQNAEPLPFATVARSTSGSLPWFDSLVTRAPDVLVGTEVIPLASYEKALQPPGRNGLYRNEQGGGTGSVEVMLKGKLLSLTRRFSEPGGPEAVRRYQSLAVSQGGQKWTGTEVDVLGVEKGLLLLESNPGVDGISSALWIEYKKVGASQIAERNK